MVVKIQKCEKKKKGKKKGKKWGEFQTKKVMQ
jgi:hypothetical protein